jgi:hypothetical protein
MGTTKDAMPTTNKGLGRCRAPPSRFSPPREAKPAAPAAAAGSPAAAAVASPSQGTRKSQLAVALVSRFRFRAVWVWGLRLGSTLKGRISKRYHPPPAPGPFPPTGPEGGGRAPW